MSIISSEIQSTTNSQYSLIFYAAQEQYSIAFYHNQELLELIQSKDLSGSFVSNVKKIIDKHTLPTQIHIINGPGSFTSTRFIVLVGKLFSSLWKIPLKTCSILECIEVLYPNCNVILSTGTMLHYVYQANIKQVHLTANPDLTHPFTTNIPMFQSEDNALAWPNLLPIALNICLHKLPDHNAQPIYTIKPIYLKTEHEVPTNAMF